MSNIVKSTSIIVAEIFKKHNELNFDNKIQSFAKSRSKLKQIDAHEINCSRQSLFLKKKKIHDIQSLIVNSNIVEKFQLLSICNSFCLIFVTRFCRNKFLKFYRLLFINSKI